MNIFRKVYGKEKEFFTSKTCGDTSKEIAHQPEMWHKLSVYLNEVKPEINGFMGKLGPLKDYRILLTGAGSSGIIGRAVAGFVAQTAGIRCEAVHTTDIVSAPSAYLFADIPTLLISFGRSGNSPESVGAVEYARKAVNNLYEIAIVCDGNSKLASATRESSKSLMLVMPEGTNDKGFAATSSVSCMLLAGFATLMHGEIDKITRDITLLAEVVEKSLPGITKAAETCAGWKYDRAWFLGSGPHTALAHEGSLKIMELTNGQVIAGHNNAAEFRHGPKTVLSPSTVTVHFISNCPLTSKYDMDLLNELCGQKSGNKIATIGGSSIKVQTDLNITYQDEGFEVLTEVAAGIQGLVFMQLMSMYTSIALNVPTDNPSPSGLVNRVVQGVTVYPYPK